MTRPSDVAENPVATSPLRKGRVPVSGVFYILCLVGIALATSIGLIEAAHRDPISIGNVAQTRAGLVVTVRADVTNHSKTARCPDIRAVARDTAAKDLVEVKAAPAEGPGRLVPRQSVRYTAVIMSLTARDFKEKFKEVAMFVYADRACPAS